MKLPPVYVAPSSVDRHELRHHYQESVHNKTFFNTMFTKIICPVRDAEDFIQARNPSGGVA